MKLLRNLLLLLCFCCFATKLKAGVDVAAIKLLSPKVFLCLGDTVPMNMVIQNVGTDTVYSVPVRANIGGIVPFVLLTTCTKTLLPGDTAVVYLGQVPCPTNGLYHFTFFTQLVNDINLHNDTAIQTTFIAHTANNMQIKDAHRCGSGPLQVAASINDGLIYWYASDTASSSIGVGDYYQTGTLNFTQTYWAEPHANVHVNLGERDTTFSTCAGTNFLVDAMSFDVFEGMALDSVKVYPLNSGMLVIRLVNNQNTVLERDTFYFTNPGGIGHFVSLKWQLQKGVGYRIDALGTTTGLLRNTNGANYPYQVPHVVSINGNTINSNYYLYFYDWHFRLGGCAGPRQAVNAYIRTQAPNANFSVQTNGGLVLFTNNTTNADSVWWHFGDGVTNITWQPNHVYSHSGLYIITLFAKNDCGIDSFKLGINVVAGVESLNLNNGKVYPNPASTLVVWEMPENVMFNSATFHLNSIDGSVIELTPIFEKNRISLPIDALPQGMYIMQVKDRSGMVLYNRFNKL